MTEEHNFEKIYKWFGIIVVALILILGLAVLFTKYFANIPVNIRIILAIFILSYGAYRLVNIWNKSKKRDHENDKDQSIN